MATPRTWQAAKAALRALWPHALTILATDGGANDGSGVEVTGTSAGAVNVAPGAGVNFPIVDQGLSFIAGGVASCATSTVIATAQSGAGYLSITNLDGSSTIYVGLTGVTTNGQPIPAGGSFTVRVADVTTIFAAGSTTVGWGFWR